MADPIELGIRSKAGGYVDVVAALEEALERMDEACAGERVWVVMVLPLPLLIELIPTALPKICG
jgi:hypothetical protein